MRRGPVLWLILSGVLLVAAITIGTGLIIGQFRERALSNGERELENTVRLLSRHFDQQLGDLEVPLNDLIAQIHAAGVTSPDAFKRYMSAAEMHLLMKAKVSAPSEIAGINVYDSEGTLINSSVVSVVPAVNIADRAYFRALKSDPEPQQIELVRSRFSGGVRTVVARKVLGPNGEFLGVVSRAIAPAKFEDYFSSVTLGKDAAISMFHRDGTLLARHPHVDPMIGRKFHAAPLLTKVLTEGGQQTQRVQSPVDHQDRLGSAAELSHFPIVVVATTTVSAALADWRAQTRFMVVTAALSALAVAFILFLIVRQMTRQNREAQLRLESEKHRLDTALNNMTQGLVLYDASARIVTTNQRYLDMYNLSTEVVKPGCHFFDLIQHRKDTGSFDGDVLEFCTAIMKNVAAGKITRSVMESADGRSFQIVNKPLAHGGWVATIEDITERRHIEQERDRNSAFLRQIIDHIPTQITVKDVRDRRYVLANRVAETQFGMSRDDIVGKTAVDLFSKEAADIIARDDERALQCPDGLFLDIGPWQTQALGERFITSRRIGIPDQSGETRYIVNVVDDVTDRRLADEKIAHLAHYDALTDLPNRVLFRERIERELQRTGRGGQFALLYIDVDEFKGINDSLGHHVGDELLKAVAARIRNCIRDTDHVARLGGDEFAVIQTDVADTRDVVDFVMRIHEAIRQPYECLGHHLTTDASIGIAMAPQDGTDIDQLIKNADLAMYGAKADGRRT
ncbi:MAG: diguanylate cyclase domain-containing protein, partial [Xanthobacteraceae bacterium]